MSLTYQKSICAKELKSKGIGKDNKKNRNKLGLSTSDQEINLLFINTMYWKNFALLFNSINSYYVLLPFKFIIPIK